MSVRSAAVILGAASVFLGACGGGGGSGGASTSSASTETAPAPFAGKLTGELILAVKGAVKPFDPWDKAFALLKSKIGEPTKVMGEKYMWSIVEGDDCTYFVVEKSNAEVGTVIHPMKIAADGAEMNRRECLSIAGAK